MRTIAASPGSNSPRLVKRRPPGEPGPTDVLCQTLELGVCGTDREILLSGQPQIPPGEPYLVLGHECLARVVEVGREVTSLAVGNLVVPVVRRGLPDLDARDIPPGRVDLLPMGRYVERGIVAEHGFSARHWLDRPEHLFAVSTDLAPWAVLTEPFSVAEKAINEALAVQRGRLGESAWRDTPPRVLVTGMGPIGFAAIAACCCLRWPTTLFGRDREDSFRTELARQFDASYLSAEMAADGDPWSLADVETQGFDLILECTGSDEVMLGAARSLASRGVMVWLGSSRVPKPKSLNVSGLMRDALLRNHIHLGSINAAPRDFRAALAHLDQLRQERPQALSALITARVAPEDSLWHYEHREPQGIKTVLEYGE